MTFTGDSTITGIIVGNGDIEDDSGTNQIHFTGGMESYPVSDLPDESQFAGIREESGTFVLAPGFDLSFGGNFNTFPGVIAGNGITFCGNAGGTINGSILNYSDEPMNLTGNNDLFFNSSGTAVVPAGFVPEIGLEYVPSSYLEVAI